VSDDCDPLVTNGSLLLNPCGLIANSLFNDVLTLTSPAGVTLDEKYISWKSDRDVKFKQIDGFKSAEVTVAENTCELALGSSYSDCKTYVDPSSGTSYFYWYPDDAKTQYLYESYPNVVSPLEGNVCHIFLHECTECPECSDKVLYGLPCTGFHVVFALTNCWKHIILFLCIIIFLSHTTTGVENEHFIVWMRAAGLPTFRKLYGKIDEDLKKHQVLTFQVDANFEVDSFDASKSIVISQAGNLGGKNGSLGVAYIVVGSVCLFLAAVFGLKQVLFPRQLGDTRYLGWAK
jgi:hypothetical protein